MNISKTFLCRPISKTQCFTNPPKMPPCNDLKADFEMGFKCRQNANKIDNREKWLYTSDRLHSQT